MAAAALLGAAAAVWWTGGGEAPAPGPPATAPRQERRAPVHAEGVAPAVHALAIAPAPRAPARAPPPHEPAPRSLAAEDDPPEAWRVPRPGTERATREELREWAAADPEGFAREARARLAGPGTLAEKMGVLRAADDAGPAAAEGVFALALDPERVPDADLRRAAALFLIRKRAAGHEWARERLYALACDARVEADLRLHAAGAVFAAAPDSSIDRLVFEAGRRLDRPAWLQAIRALARNPAPRAREVLAEVAATRAWDPEAQAAASDALRPPESPDGEPASRAP